MSPEESKVPLKMVVNGKPVEVKVDPTWTLLYVLREELKLTGTKKGCEKGDCGACTVLLEGKPVNSCLVLALQAEGKESGNHRRPGHGGLPSSPPKELHRQRRRAMRLLHPGNALVRGRALEKEPQPDRKRDPDRDLRQPLPLHGLPKDSQGHPELFEIQMKERRGTDRPLRTGFLPNSPEITCRE